MIVIAVSDELVLAHPLGPVSTVAALTLIVGPILFLFGSVMAVLAIWGRIAWTRLAACGLLAALWLALPWLNPLTLSAMTTGIMLGVGLLEMMAVKREAPSHA